MAAAELQDKYAIPDFPLTGTRDLTADDYVYAIRRLASPRVVSPIYSLMAEYVHGLKDYGDRLRLRDQALRRDAPGGRGLALAGLARGRWLRRRAGAGSADTAHPRQRQVSPVQVLAGHDLHGADPWEADRFYSQPGMAEQDLSFNTWPVGTGYMLVESLQNRRHVLARNPNFHGEPYPAKASRATRPRACWPTAASPRPSSTAPCSTSRRKPFR